MQYRLADAAGGTYFFTVNLAERRSDVLVRHIDDLRAAMKTVRDAHPFAVLAMVVLPEHLHAIWRLPSGDADYPLRWSLIKVGSRGGWQKASTFVPAAKPSVSAASGSGGIGNIKSGNEIDLARHVDYIHCNPVKHGWVNRPVDWPHSTLHGYIERGMAASDWGGEMGDGVDGYGER